MSKATKLRFALITEDVLDKLRPRSQSENTRSKYMNEIYVAIRTAVNEVIDEKLLQLSSTIDQMVEERVTRILDQRVAGGSGLAPSSLSKGKRERGIGDRRDNKDHKDHKDLKDHKDAETKATAECSSSLRLPALKKRRPKKPTNPMKEHVTFAPEDHLLKKPRTKTQKVTVIPIHRENPVKSSPSSSGNNQLPLATPPPPMLHMDHNRLVDEDEDEDDDTNFSDVEEPSILTIAAKYLKKLEDARRRKQQH
ncbi:hypothetical protein KR084_006441 [Drosophila pseudotakahashii]|nr:hypothetical protein KR084_006441 [Drosophila pseudotakahashii]